MGGSVPAGTTKVDSHFTRGPPHLCPDGPLLAAADFASLGAWVGGERTTPGVLTGPGRPARVHPDLNTLVSSVRRLVTGPVSHLAGGGGGGPALPDRSSPGPGPGDSGARSASGGGSAPFSRPRSARGWREGVPAARGVWTDLWTGCVRGGGAGWLHLEPRVARRPGEAGGRPVVTSRRAGRELVAISKCGEPAAKGRLGRVVHRDPAFPARGQAPGPRDGEVPGPPTPASLHPPRRDFTSFDISAAGSGSGEGGPGAEAPCSASPGPAGRRAALRGARLPGRGRALPALRGRTMARSGRAGRRRARVRDSPRMWSRAAGGKGPLAPAASTTILPAALLHVNMEARAGRPPQAGSAASIFSAPRAPPSPAPRARTRP